MCVQSTPMLPAMSDTAFDARLARLIANLDEITTLLRDHGETHWLPWAMRCRNELETYDSAAFDHVLGAFGGMGSLNDLLILTANGHAVRPGQEHSVNDRLSHLRHVIWDDATAIRHELRESS
jgi:hypothetical protein